MFIVSRLMMPTQILGLVVKYSQLCILTPRLYAAWTFTKAQILGTSDRIRHFLVPSVFGGE